MTDSSASWLVFRDILGTLPHQEAPLLLQYLVSPFFLPSFHLSPSLLGCRPSSWLATGEGNHLGLTLRPHVLSATPTLPSRCPRSKDTSARSLHSSLYMKAETSSVMRALVLVLWALLMSAECAGSPTGPGENLSCYQCFKVPSQAFCTPTACASTDRVCVSNAVIFTLRLGVKILLSKRCAPRCPNTNMKFEWLSDPPQYGTQSLLHEVCYTKKKNAPELMAESEAGPDPSLHCLYFLRVNSTSFCIPAACTPVEHLFCSSYKLVFQIASPSSLRLPARFWRKCPWVQKKDADQQGLHVFLLHQQPPDLSMIPAENISHAKFLCCPSGMCNQEVKGSSSAPQIMKGPPHSLLYHPGVE
nr:PREDICTED: uncharacterized protein LOC105073837 [Camelus bactrianus]